MKPMPLYHTTAALLGFLNVLEAGGTICIGHKFSTKTFWPEVRSSGATVVQYVGETCRYLLSAPAQSDPVTGENLDRKHNVRLAFGNGLRPDVWDEFKERFGIEQIAEFYGATEGHLATWNLSRNGFSQGAIGRNGWLFSALMGVNLAVVEVDHDTEAPRRDRRTNKCKAVAPGETGELLFRVPAGNGKDEDTSRRFQGYYGNPGATEAKIMRDVFRDGDAWFRTGDVIRWDKDGRVFFSDRIGDTYRWKSENVSTQEVAEALGSHPAVREVNVYGVQLPRHDGRVGCAAVVFGDGSDTRNASVSPNNHLLHGIAQHVMGRLPRYALPIFLRVMPRVGMQMTGTNKMQKKGLQDEGIKLGGGSEGAMYWLRDGTYRLFSNKDWNDLDGGKVKL